MHHLGHGRQKVRRTDHYGRTDQVISCMRLVQTLDLREREVCRDVQDAVYVMASERETSSQVYRCRQLEEEVEEVAAHRTVVRQYSSGHAAVNPSRAGLCFAVWDQHPRLRYHLSGRLHRRTWLCSRRLFRHDHVIGLREGLISMGRSE